MRNAEQVTFGGSALDRAAELRGDSDALTRLRTDPEARFILFWRGKPLLNGVNPVALALLKAGDEILISVDEPILFLGLSNGGAVFAADISSWEPKELDKAQLDAFLDSSEQHHPALPADYKFQELRGHMAQLTPHQAELIVTAKALFGWHRSHQFCANCGETSKISMAGWQRDCPACNSVHFPRSDPVVIMLITKGNNVLIGRSPDWPEKMYSLLAGFLEPGETIEAAVRREVFEESGIEVGAVSYLASQPWPFPSSLMVGCSGEALTDEITIDPNEIEDALWVSREDMMLAFSGDHPDLLPARVGSIAHFLLLNWLADRLN